LSIHQKKISQWKVNNHMNNPKRNQDFPREQKQEPQKSKEELPETTKIQTRQKQQSDIEWLIQTKIKAIDTLSLKVTKKET
ncbi:hypothetical protein ACJMK2_001590, partial [Sinanodonta woodiana]